MNTITTLIPQYGELNRISKDWIVSHTFSFEKQKFIACMQPIRRQLQGSHQGRDGSGKQATQTDERSQQPL